MASIKAIQSCGELCARIVLQVFLFRKMTHDLTTAWNIPLASCFNRAMVYSCSANGVRVELLIYPRLDSLGAQVLVEGLASGIAVSAIHLHIPLFGLRVTDFGRFIETEEVWRSDGFLKRNAIHLHQHQSSIAVFLQIGFVNPGRTQAVTEHRAHLKELFVQHWHSDWIIRVGNEDFPVHKAIVSSRSPVLRAIINNQQTNNWNYFIIEDFDVDVVRTMLLFLYTGEVHTTNIAEMAYELYKIADKYLIDSLKRICELEIIKQLDADNAVDILVLASSPSGESLKARLLPALVKLGSSWLSNPKFESFVQCNSTIVREIIRAYETFPKKLYLPPN